MNELELEVRRKIVLDLVPFIAANGARRHNGLFPETQVAAKHRMAAYATVLEALLPKNHGVDIGRIAKDVYESQPEGWQHPALEEAISRKMTAEVNMVFDLAHAASPGQVHPQVPALARLFAEAYIARHNMRTSDGGYLLKGRYEGLAQALMALVLPEGDSTELARIDFLMGVSAGYRQVGDDPEKLAAEVVAILAKIHPYQA